MIRVLLLQLVVATLAPGFFCHAAHPLAAPGVTSLTNSGVAYQATDQHHVTLKRGDVTVIFVDNPAWDFQWFIPDYKIGEGYGLKMRAAYIPCESHEQIEQDTRPHREALGHR